MSDTSKNKSAWIWLVTVVILAAMFCVGLAVFHGENKPETEPEPVYVLAPCSSEDCIKKDYGEIETLFRNAGFKNIKTEAIEDLITGWITKDGSVEKVSVGGNSVFSEGENFTEDTEVIIIYHTFKPESPLKDM